MHPIWRVRAVTLAVVAVFVVSAQLLWPDPNVRAQYSYLATLTLGYGHLIGGAWFSRQKMRAMYPPSFRPRLFTLFLWVGVLNLFALYEWILISFGQWVVLGFLVFSTWHTFENDAGLRLAYDDDLKLAKVPRDFWYHLTPVGITAWFIVLAGAAMPGELPLEAVGGMACRVVAVGTGVLLLLFRRSPGGLAAAVFLIAGTLTIPREFGPQSAIQFADVFNAAVLYHLISWLVFFHDRGKRLPPDARRDMWKRIGWVHLPAALVCLVLLVIPHPALNTARLWVFSPAVYLFWSVAHVIQTFVVRGVEPSPSQSLAPEPAE